MTIEESTEETRVLTALIMATRPLDDCADELHQICWSLQESMEQYPDESSGNEKLIEEISQVIVNISASRLTLMKGTEQLKKAWELVEH